jgi:hypothetical protein
MGTVMRDVVGLVRGNCEARYPLVTLGRATALLLLALVVAPVISLFIDGCALAKTQKEEVAEVLDDPNACSIDEIVPWNSNHSIEDFRPATGIIPPKSPQIYYALEGRVVHNRSGTTYVYPEGSSFYGFTSRLRRVKPCPMGVAAQAFDWTGLSIGGSVGSRSISDTVTDPLQFTFCPLPPIPCTPDPTPDPSATLKRSGGAGNVFLTYNQRLFTMARNTDVMIGGEGFIGHGWNNNILHRGFPGTGGIAPWSVAANDSVIANFGTNGGLVFKAGPVFDVAGTSIYLALDVGFGWQRVDLTFNCTMSGVCGFNGISPGTLDWKKTMTGSLLGGEVNLPMSSVPLISQFPVLSGGTVGFQYLHGDFGNFTMPSGHAAPDSDFRRAECHEQQLYGEVRRSAYSRDHFDSFLVDALPASRRPLAYPPPQAGEG